MRATWTRTPVIALVGVLALGAGAWWGLVRGDGGATTGSGGRRSRPVDLGEVVDLVPGCTIDTCRVLAGRGGFRFGGGDATLILVASPERCSVHFVTPGAVLWSSPVAPSCLDPVGGVETDRTGHAFLVLPPEEGKPGDGRAEVVVLRARGDEVEDFGSLDHRFAGSTATARDLDDDGVFEVVVDRDVHRWNGRAYVAA